MSDGAGTQCNNCGGWIHLHYAIIDGAKMLTGKCVNCGQFTDVLPEDRDTGEKVMDYDAYPGKGQFVVEIRRPGQPVRGCRYENANDALKFMRSVPTIPGGSVSIYSTTGFGCQSRTVRWPQKESDLNSRQQGLLDAYAALIGEFEHSLDYDMPLTPESLRQWEKESKEIEGRYGATVRCELGLYANFLENKLSKGETYETAAKTIIACLKKDLEMELLLQKELTGVIE